MDGSTGSSSGESRKTRLMLSSFSLSSRMASVLVMVLTCGTAALCRGQEANIASSPTSQFVYPRLDQVQSARADVLERRIRVRQALAEAYDESMQVSFKHELDQLDYLGLLYAQQEVLLQKESELQRLIQVKDEDPATWALQERQIKPPYTFVMLEKLRDDYDNAQERLELYTVELNSVREMADHAQEYDQDRNRERRRVEEQIRDSTDPTEHARLSRELVTATLACEISQELKLLRDYEVHVKELEISVQAHRVEAFRSGEQLIAQKVPFTENDLSALLADLGVEKSKIQSQLTDLQDRISASIMPTSTGLGEVGGNAIQTSPRELHRQSMANLNESLADLVMLGHAWQLRFRWTNGQMDSKEEDHSRDQVARFIAHSDNSRKVLELRLKEMRQRLLHLDSMGALPETQAESLALREAIAIGESRLILLNRAGRVLNRFDDQLNKASVTAQFSEKLSAFFDWANDCWHYEVMAVDDRPITVGKIAIAILSLFGGVFVSRRLSRMLGRRMLPRFGIHEGASMALQTIGFYCMVMICGFVTLDMLNIPLTVFTFLGGAAAIAVGFGSQNVLNNFISGLIILGEQPIRIGDLVEVDGLHANIEHIGPRSTRVRTGSNLEIIIPNSRFLENNVTNWTLSNNEIRVCVKVGVAYGSPVEQVMTLLQQAVDEEPRVLDHPDAIILFYEFADNSLNFEVHFWVRMRTIMEGRRAESEVRKRIDQLFREHDITIAFPQRDVHLDLNRPIEISMADPNVASKLSHIRRAA